MTLTGLRPCLLIASLAAWLPAGCAGVQSPIAAPSALQSSFPPGTHDARRSWMLPEAKHEDLLYVADQTAEVLIYSYKDKFKLVGTIYPPGFPLNGICGDGAGNVWVPTGDSGAGEVTEYAHGSTQPTTTLYDAGYYLSGCAVDNVTGDLAVTSVCTGSGCSVRGGSVAIYKHAKGHAKTYMDPQMGTFYYCTYDDEGNLFVDGAGYYDSHPQNLAELPLGKKKLRNISLNQGFTYPGGIQWDGAHLAIGDRYENQIYQFTIAGQRGNEISVTYLDDTAGALQFWFENGDVIVPGYTSGNVDFYKYPQGVVVSVAPAAGRDKPNVLGRAIGGRSAFGGE